jgi:hypothetical protein
MVKTAGCPACIKAKSKKEKGKMVKKIGFGLISALLASTAFAQLTTSFAGIKNAVDYAYGLPGVNFPALNVATGNTTTGTATITLVTGATTNSAGALLFPLAIDAPITVGIGSNAETVTPTAVSNCNLPPSQVYQCQVTASFSNLHGAQEPVTSGTYGLQEALNAALAAPGGIVVVDPRWANLGGLTTTITAATLSGPLSGFTSLNGFSPVVVIEDNRGQAAGSTLPPPAYWFIRPSIITTITAPAAPTNAKVTGSLTSGSYYTTYECVDALGGISVAATDSAQATTATGLVVTLPATPCTGAVGWIPMITAASGSTGSEIEVPVTATVCTVATALVSTGKPVCAMNSTATILTAPSTTAKVVTEGTFHTTMAIVPFSSLPAPFQTQYAPFVVGGTLNSGATANEDLAQFYTPANYFSTIGKAFNVCFKAATATQVASSVIAVALDVATQYGQSPIALSTVTFGTYTQAAAGTIQGCWKIQNTIAGTGAKFWASTPVPFTNALNSVPGSMKFSSDVSTAVDGTAVDTTNGLYWSINFAETAGDNVTGPIINQVWLEPVTAN